MTDTDMLYMGAQEKRINDLEEEIRSLKELLREVQPVLRYAFFAHYTQQNTADGVYDKITKVVGKELL